MIRFLSRLSLAAIFVYVVLVIYIYAVQRTLLFRPVSEGSQTPKDFALTYEDVLFPSFDQTHLHGWFIPNDTLPAARKKISLLYCHGNGASLSRLAHVTKIFVDYGFEPFLFTYRGYGSSEKGSHAELALLGDAVAAYDWLKARRPDSPIIAWGHSLGASVCAGMAMQRPLSGLILEAPFASVPQMASINYPWLPIFPSLIFDQFLTTHFVAYRKQSPLLILHSKLDHIIPISQGQKVFAKAKAPKDFIELDGIDHNDFPDVASSYKGQISEWINKLPLESDSLDLAKGNS